MSLTVSLTSLINQVQILADNHRLTTTQITLFVNQGYTMLYDKLTDAMGADYNLSITTFNTSTTSTYAFSTIAPDFYKLRGVDVQFQGTQYLPLKPFIWKDRNAYTNAYATFGQFPGTYLRYRVQGATLVFTPTPTTVNQIRLSYTPAPTLMSSGTDTIDGVSGWEQYIVNHAAIQCLINEETDASQIMAQQAQIEARISKMAQNRDTGEPTRVAAASDCDDFPFGFGGW